MPAFSPASLLSYQTFRQKKPRFFDTFELFSPSVFRYACTLPAATKQHRDRKTIWLRAKNQRATASEPVLLAKSYIKSGYIV